ncbi:multidrug ABC transporter ATP-binding protein [Actibacterium mucosum KCTC 23349]|uniref:Multidrug ABC transporter ATP-binding protein n=1 Tax=Actibacterium mucosum KCTC 23349 TaxID=1454373 RepID=A0A037ZNZ0_9RHOB|nr:multidrug ABC transporter ATP-binding protein [Actibacterium mucosum KCTC 23349]
MGLMRLVDRHDPFVKIDTPPPQKLLPFMVWGLRGTYPILAAGTLASGLGGTLDIIAAFLLGLVIDTALAHGPDGLLASHFWLFFGITVFVLFLRPVIFAANAVVQNLLLGPGASAQVQARLHRWTLGQSVSFFDNDFAGRIAQKEMQTSAALTETAVEVINTIVFALVSVISAAVILMAVDWRVAIILLVWIVLYLRFIAYFMPRIRVQAKGRAGARAGVTGQIVDTITNMRTVKLFAHSAHEDRAAIDAIQTYRQAAIRYGVISVSFRTLLMVLAGFLPVLLVGMSIYFWTQGSATAGQIAAIGAMSLRLSQMTGWVSFTLMGIYSKIGEIEDGMRTLNVPHDLVDAPDAAQMPEVTGHIHFDNVTFSYGRDTGGVFDLSLDIAPGEKVGIVGASGAGKSTLVSTLLRLYDTEKGRVLIDGHDVAGVTQESLRRQIGMVTQETAMFNRSARDNILYGQPDASEDDVIAAAKRAEAHDFIPDLTDFQGRKGYDAYLGERGVKLSGGQRQRIALARAFLKDAPILVLDEATSALDSEVEAAIQSALGRVMEGKTVLAIAHRLSTIAQMDRIIVLESGRIAEEGSHDQLLQAGGLYAKFWARQSGGFIGVKDAAE